MKPPFCSTGEEENRLLLEMLRTKDAALGLLEEQVKLLTSQVEWMKRQLFGRKSERIDPNQMFLDGVVIEAVERNPPAEPAPAGPTSRSRRTRARRRPAGAVNC